ncbi:hypothetical protein D3C73_1510800 [compost metagenome]
MRRAHELGCEHVAPGKGASLAQRPLKQGLHRHLFNREAFEPLAIFDRRRLCFLHIGRLGVLPLDQIRVVRIGDLQETAESCGGFWR